MKPFLLLSFMIIFGKHPVLFAQPVQAGGFTGVNIAYFETPNNYRSHHPVFSIPAGVMISKSLNESYGLQVEINYIRMGERINGMQQLSKAELDIASLPDDIHAFACFRKNIKLHYIQVPFLVRTTIRLNSAVTYYTVFGPAMSFLANGKEIIKGDALLYADYDGKIPFLSPENNEQYNICFDNKISIKEKLKTFVLNGIAGAGIKINMGSNSLFFETRLTAGLTNIYQHSSREGEGYTNSLTFMAGYNFPLK